MSKPAGGGDPVASYWESVVEAADSPIEAKSKRALELLRLKEVADEFRGAYLPELPAITIATADIGGRSSGKVDPVGSWGQGVSIQLKTSRVDPFNTKGADAGLPPTLGDRSLIFGHPLQHTQAGERLRKQEAELLVMQQLLRAFQHLTDERELPGFVAARSDLKSYGGNGSWYAAQANAIWRKWCCAEGFPFVPVRHSRQNYELEHPSISEANPADERFGWLRPSCSGWPMSAMAQARDPRISGPAPEGIKVGGSAIPIDPGQWDRWCKEDVAQSTAVFKRVEGGDHGMLFEALKWPKEERPKIDEVDGDPVVQIPAASKPIQTCTKIDINFNAPDALQAVEAVLTGVDRDRGSSLWPEFLQLACNHPAAPGASRVQTELAVDLDSTPIDPGQVDLAEAIAAQCGTDLERATAVVERIRKFLLTPIEPEPEPVAEPMPVVLTESQPAANSLRARVDAIQAASSQSDLRKLPEWPAGPRRSQATGQRVRLTKEQAAVRDAEIQTRIKAGLSQIEIARELSEWCGQGLNAIATRVRELQKLEAA